jgi:hypothetical protein
VSIISFGRTLIQYTLTKGFCRVSSCLGSHQAHYLCEGRHVVMGLEERVPPAEDAQKYHTSRPDVNGSGLVRVFEENFGSSESRSTSTRGCLVAPGGRGRGGGREKEREGEREGGEVWYYNNFINMTTHTHLARQAVHTSITLCRSGHKRITSAPPPLPPLSVPPAAAETLPPPTPPPTPPPSLLLVICPETAGLGPLIPLVIAVEDEPW